MKESEAVIGTDSLLVFVPGPDTLESPLEGAPHRGKGGFAAESSCHPKPKLKLVRPALEIAQPIVPASPKSGMLAGQRAKESYSDEILRIALDRMISHAAHEILDDATRPFFEPETQISAEGSSMGDRTESAVHAVIEPKNLERSGHSTKRAETESRKVTRPVTEAIS